MERTEPRQALSLENAMNESFKDSGAILSLALQPGDVAVPQRLLDAVEQLDSPVDLIISPEPAEGPFEALREEFPALLYRRFGGRPSSPDESEQVIRLLRWVLIEMSEWAYVADQKLTKLTTIFVVLNDFSWDDSQWTTFSETAVSKELSRVLGALLRGYSVTVDFDSASRITTTNNLLEVLAHADNDGDWVTISDYWQQIETWLHAPCFLKHAAPCLARFDMGSLIEFADHASSILEAYLVAASLSAENRLKLARASSSNRYRFAALLSIQWQRDLRNGLPDGAAIELIMLLSQGANDALEWRRWMYAFNKYPLRFPALQPSLGNALTHAPEEALTAYIESIELHVWPLDGSIPQRPLRPDSRQCVAQCLEEFHRAANQLQRHILWRKAHDRWHLWRFGVGSVKDPYLFNIAGSELDYAVAAYAVECLESNERQDRLTALEAEAHGIETGWYPSRSHLTTRWYSLVSEMQPLFATIGINPLFISPVIPESLNGSPYRGRRHQGVRG